MLEHASRNADHTEIVSYRKMMMFLKTQNLPMKWQALFLITGDVVKLMTSWNKSIVIYERVRINEWSVRRCSQRFMILYMKHINVWDVCGHFPYLRNLIGTWLFVVLYFNSLAADGFWFAGVRYKNNGHLLPHDDSSLSLHFYCVSNQTLDLSFLHIIRTVSVNPMNGFEIPHWTDKN